MSSKLLQGIRFLSCVILCEFEHFNPALVTWSFETCGNQLVPLFVLSLHLLVLLYNKDTSLGVSDAPGDQCRVNLTSGENPIENVNDTVLASISFLFCGQRHNLFYCTFLMSFICRIRVSYFLKNEMLLCYSSLKLFLS